MSTSHIFQIMYTRLRCDNDLLHFLIKINLKLLCVNYDFCKSIKSLEDILELEFRSLDTLPDNFLTNNVLCQFSAWFLIESCLLSS